MTSLESLGLVVHQPTSPRIRPGAGTYRTVMPIMTASCCPTAAYCSSRLLSFENPHEGVAAGTEDGVARSLAQAV